MRLALKAARRGSRVRNPLRQPHRQEPRHGGAKSREEAQPCAAGMCNGSESSCLFK